MLCHVRGGETRVVSDTRPPLAQITDAEASYGGYSGAVPNEKITWGKLDPGTPRFHVASDATIVAPLVFAWVLGD